MSAPRRQTPMSPQMGKAERPMAARLVIAILGGWGAAQLTLVAFGLSQIWSELAVDANSLLSGELWRLLTSLLVHANVWQFAATLGAFFIWGRELELIIGTKSFCGLCLTAALLGEIASCSTALAVKSSGFSAAAAAVLAAHATVLPDLLSTRLARLKAGHFACSLFAIAIALVASGKCLDIGPAGVALGTIVGWCWARQLGFGHLFWFHRRKEEQREKAMRRDRLNADEFLEQEIDPILEKISREGVGSLTKRERAILEEGRGKLAHRTTQNESN